MNRYFSALACLVALPGLVLSACPTPYTSYYRSYYPSYSYSYPTYSYPVVTKIVKEVIREKVIPVAAYVPTPIYFATTAISTPPAAVAPAAAPAAPAKMSYANGQQAAAPNGNGNGQSDLRAILELLQKMDQRIGRLEDAVFKGGPAPARDPAPRSRGGAEPPPPQAAPKDGLAVANARCASCHEKAKADDHGKGFVLLEGGKLPASLTPAGKLKSVRMVLSARMPLGADKKPVPLSDEEAAALVALLTN